MTSIHTAAFQGQGPAGAQSTQQRNDGVDGGGGRQGGATAHAAAAAAMTSPAQRSKRPRSTLKTTKQRSRNALKPYDDLKLLLANASMDAAIRLMQQEREKAANGRLPLGFRKRLVEALQEAHPWITEDVLASREGYQKRKEREQNAAKDDDNQQKPAAKRQISQTEQVSLDGNETTAHTGRVSDPPPPAKRNKGGRPPKASSRTVMAPRSTAACESQSPLNAPDHSSNLDSSSADGPPPVKRNKGGGPPKASSRSVMTARSTAASESPLNAPDHSSNPDSSSQPKKRKKGGRPKGTTVAAKKELSKREKLAIDRATILYAEERKACRAKGMQLRKGTMAKVIEQAKKEFQVPDLHISPATIRSRIGARELTPQSLGPRSPMAPLEPVLVEFCKRVNKKKLPLDSTEFLKLANALVKGSEVEQAVLEFVRHSCGACTDSVNLTVAYWRGFRKRHDDEIGKFHVPVLMGGAKHYYDKENLALSYETVYNDMVREGIGRKLNSPVWIVQETAYTNDEAAGKGSADGGGAWL